MLHLSCKQTIRTSWPGRDSLRCLRRIISNQVNSKPSRNFLFHQYIFSEHFLGIFPSPPYSLESLLTIQPTRLDIVPLLFLHHFPWRHPIDRSAVPSPGPPLSIPNHSSTSAGVPPTALPPPFPSSTSWASCATPLPPSPSTTPP